MTELKLIRPDDWHLHLRDGNYLNTTVPAAAKRFARALVMPNLKPPVVRVAEAVSYRQRILNAIPKNTEFQPLMTLYLTDNTTVDDVRQAKNAGFIMGYKLYPAGATTHSAAGVTNIEKIYSTLEAMMENNLVLLIHGEVTDEKIDIFAREKTFIEKILNPLTKRFPTLRIVLEHVSTRVAVEWVSAAPKNVAATITAHHLLLNRNDLLVGGIKPHFYCLPILKTRDDQTALIAAATSGNPKFFLGTDSAPHAQFQKENACGCAGIYTSHAAIEFYAEIFEQANALDKLEGFASFYGADFYQLPCNQQHITLRKESWQIPESLAYDSERLIPLHAGQSVTWKLAENV